MGIANHPLVFLRVLDELVRHDARPPGFTGRIAIGMIGQPTVFWGATIERDRIETSFFTDLPALADWNAVVFVSDEGLTGEGDLSLFDRLTERYLRRETSTATAESLQPEER